MTESENVVVERLLRMAQVENLCGIKRSSIYQRIKEGTFPPPVKLSPRVSVWPQSRITQWMSKVMKEVATQI